MSKKCKHCKWFLKNKNTETRSDEGVCTLNPKWESNMNKNCSACSRFEAGDYKDWRKE